MIEDEGEYVSTTGGAVTLEYGDVVADLATRLGVDPATIAKIRSVVQDVSKDLKQRLTTAQTHIKTVRADLAKVEGGTLSPQQRTGSPDAPDEHSGAAGEDRERRQEARERHRGRPRPSSRTVSPSSTGGYRTSTVG